MRINVANFLCSHLPILIAVVDHNNNRYYRLWIYTCNAVLLMAVIIFCGVAGKFVMHLWQHGTWYVLYYHCIIHRRHIVIRLQTFISERIKLEPTKFHIRLFSFAGAIRYIEFEIFLWLLLCVILIQTYYYRFPTINRVSWCLKTIWKIIKCLLVTSTGAFNRRCNFRNLLDVQIR